MHQLERTFGSKPSYVYRGKGNFNSDTSGESSTYPFICTQWPNGQILLSCDDTPVGKRVSGFEGVTEDGNEFSAEFYFPSPRRADRQGSIWTVRESQFSIHNRSKSNLGHVIFPITNFCFTCLPKNKENLCDRSIVYPNSFFCEINGNEIAIKQVEQYDDIVSKLRLWKYPQVTAEVITSVSSSQEISGFKKTVDDLTTLLSLARGTTVNWIAYEVTDDSESLLERYHYSAVVKPFGSHELIPYRDGFKSETKNFLEQSFPRYRRLNQGDWLKHSIEAYVDALSENDYLQLRGLKTVEIMEFLTHYYLEHFKGWQPKKIENTSFKKCIKLLVDRFSLYSNTINNQDIKDFKDRRNNLIHEMAFENSKNSKSLSLKDRLEIYYFLISFVGKTLLAILDYGGGYVAWEERDLEKNQTSSDLVKKFR